MTKNTNKNKEVNRLCVTFEHPEILQEFNNYFYDKYNTVRGYRVQVLEDLISSFNETQKINNEKPQIIKDNLKLTNENKALQEEINNLKNKLKEATTLTHDHDNNNKKMANEIEDLKKKLNNYNTIKEENIRLQETNKKYLSDIDHLTNNIDNLKKQLATTHDDLNNTRNDYKTLVNTHEETINKHEKNLTEIIKDHTKNIAELNTTLKEKEETNKTLTAYTVKLKEDLNNKDNEITHKNEYINTLKNTNIINRIFKKYPEETIEEIKELTP